MKIQQSYKGKKILLEEITFGAMSSALVSLKLPAIYQRNQVERP